MKKIAGIILGCLTLLCTSVLHAAPESTLKRIKDEKKIRIAHRESSSPFSFVVANNKRPMGYAVDICLQSVEAVKRHLSVPDIAIEWVMVSASERLPALDSGRADMECGATTNNAERRQKFAFSVPYYIAGVRMLVRTDSQVKSLEHLIGKNVAATKGTTALKLLRQVNENRVLNMVITETGSDSEAVKLLREKKIDALFNDDILLSGYRAALDKPSELSVEGELLSVEPYAIVMRQDPEFNRVVNRELTRMAIAKEIDALYAKWFLQEIPPKNLKLDLPMGHLLRDSLKFPSERIP